MNTPVLNINKNRIESFDIAKGIGILLMVMGHTGLGDGFDKLIHTFHMPLFFFISGYFYRPEKTKSFKEYLLHQINVLIIPYIFFAIFYEILHFIYVGDFSIQYFFKSLISSNHNRIDVAGALWFLMSLFTAKIIYCALHHGFRSLLNLSLVIIVISFISMTFRRHGIMLPFCMDSALSMLIVIHAGYILYVFRDKNLIHRLSTLSPIVILIIAILFFASGLINDPVNVRRNKYGIEVLYMISCICGILLTMNISHLLSKPGNILLSRIKSMFSFWGRESVVFLLVNELFLFIAGELLIILGVSRPLLAENYWLRALLMIIAMGLMSVLAMFSYKFPFSYLFGKKLLIKRKKSTNESPK